MGLGLPWHKLFVEPEVPDIRPPVVLHCLARLCQAALPWNEPSVSNELVRLFNKDQAKSPINLANIYMNFIREHGPVHAMSM